MSNLKTFPHIILALLCKPHVLRYELMPLISRAYIISNLTSNTLLQPAVTYICSVGEFSQLLSCLALLVTRETLLTRLAVESIKKSSKQMLDVCART